MVAAEDLLGHAVRAAGVAPVGDGDPQVTQRAVQAVQQPGGLRLGSRLGPAGRARTGRPDRPRTWDRSTSQAAITWRRGWSPARRPSSTTVSLPAHLLLLPDGGTLAAAPGSRYAAYRLPLLRGHRAVDREWERLGYQDAILKLFHENADCGLGRVRRYARGR
jgi:hypothetical protein